MDVWRQMREDLSALRRRGLDRTERVVDSPADARVTVDGVECVNLCGNNYLGLANHPGVRDAAIEAIRQWGVGAGASRLISGTTALHVRLQEALAAFEGTESAIVTSTGWQANACAIAAVAGEGDLILADKLDHASILDAARGCGATFRTYRHGDIGRLRRLLERLRGAHKRCAIVTDGVFSMDGDLAPLAELVAVKKHYDCLLVVDEAHATGVLGPTGRGAAEEAGVAGEVDVTVATLSKALGALGGFVAGRRELIDTIFNAGRAFIYTTALPAAMCAAALAALKIAADEPDRRQRCLDNARHLRAALAEVGIDTGASRSPIIPVMVGDSRAAVELSRAALAEGFLVPAIRPPTVPPGSARLRVTTMATHERDDLSRFADVMARAKCPGGALSPPAE